MIFGIFNDAGGVCEVCCLLSDSVTRHRKSADLLVFGLCSCKMAQGMSAWMFVML